ncbi:MAG: SelB C-terminal domain-containing protein [Azonexus sp.]|nr:SelB C-terminal domain-containing protein [Azonexus sp.]MDR0775921.1 SelB C-terminal domain-containing protein [Azonexus sp.]
MRAFIFSRAVTAATFPIHILELFDRIGYTCRVRDARLLRDIPEQLGS